MRLSAISGVDRSELEARIDAKAHEQLKMKKQAEEEAKGDTEISIIDSLLM